MQGRRREQGWCVFVSFSFKFKIRWGGRWRQMAGAGVVGPLT